MKGKETNEIFQKKSFHETCQFLPNLIILFESKNTPSETVPRWKINRRIYNSLTIKIFYCSHVNCNLVKFTSSLDIGALTFPSEEMKMIELLFNRAPIKRVQHQLTLQCSLVVRD